ncbi:MAG: autotransporter outer membrane beta-barrel domain-containing protein, partial [Opitutus sp.]
NADTTVGAYFAYGKTVSGLGSTGSETSVKEKTLGVRAGWTNGPMFAEAMLAYGFNDYSATRPIVFPGTATVAHSSTSGHQWTTGFMVGEHLNAGPLQVSPFASLLLSRWSANSFTETDAGAFNASVAGQSARSLRSQLGVEGRLDWQFGTLRLQPHAQVAWQHEFSDNSRALNASFSGVNYAVMTRRASRSSVLYSAGVDLVLGPSALLYTDVTAESGGVTKVLNEWRVGVAVLF